MFPHSFTVAALAIGAGLISAQSISSTCKSAIANIAASPDAACLNPSALVSLALVGNSSIIAPVDNWLTGLCALGPCSNSSLSAIVTNITSGCGTDLSDAGLSSVSASDLTTLVEKLYPGIRRIACLKDTSAGQFCVTETLTNIQNVYGTVTLSNLFDIFPANNSFPSNITCTNCVKQTYNIIVQEFPSESPVLAPPLQSQCGSDFTDGSSASGISEIASTSTSTSASTNAAAGAFSLISGGALAGLAASHLIAVFAGFAFLM